jgi:putative transposase
LVDTQGLLLTVVVHSANLQDREGAKSVFLKARDDAPKLQIVWADQGYQGRLVKSVPMVCGFKLRIIKRTTPGFQILPRRWVVERTFAWIGRNRRLSKDYEELPEVDEALIYISMIRLMLKRLTKKKNTS